MSKLPVIDPLEQVLERREILLPLRPYLGMSMLGHTCDRYLWYYFRWCFETRVTPRVKRIFDRGHLEEPRVVADLRAAGMIVENCLEEQNTYSDITGHILGHGDGDVQNIPGAEKTKHLLEIKTMKASKFREMVKFGLKRANPGYYCQVQIYMKKEGLTRALFIVTNKDDESRYYERVHFIPEEADQIEDRGLNIIGAEFAPARISNQPEWHVCRMCNAVETCFGRCPPPVTCRTCEHVSIEMKGQWKCGQSNENIPLEVQRTGCPLYRAIPVI